MAAGASHDARLQAIQSIETGINTAQEQIGRGRRPNRLSGKWA